MNYLRKKMLDIQTVAILAVLVAVVVAFVAVVISRRDSNSTEKMTHVTTFKGDVVSLYPDGQGGCVKAYTEQGVDIADDANCGPFWVSPKLALQIGTKVSATAVNELGTAGEAVQGFLLEPQ